MKRQNQIVFYEVPEATDSVYEIILAHKPRSEEEEEFKKRLEKALENDDNNKIWVPNIESYIKTDLSGKKRLDLREGKKPAICRSFQWYKEQALTISKQCKTRVGTLYEYLRYCARSILQIMQENPNLSEKEVWNMMCNDSTMLGNYDSNMKLTGSYKIFGHADFGNTFKLTDINSDDKKEQIAYHYVVGGSYRTVGNIFPITNVYKEPNSMVNMDMTPFIICEKNPEGILGKVID